MKKGQSKVRPFLALTLLLVGLFTVGSLVTAAPVQIHEVTDAPAALQEVEQNNYSHRLIVQLESPSLSEMAAEGSMPRTESGHLDFASTEAQAYVEQLRSEQADFIAEMNKALPDASVSTFINEAGQNVQATYQITFNGVAVDAAEPHTQVSKATVLKLQALPGVKAVYHDYSYEPDLYSSLDLINAPALWSQLGGREDAGTGVKLASMDGGLHHDAPMFDGTGWSYPAGFPKGDTNNTNGKIIASRAYFRSWDPPAPGDENTWPGENGTSHGVHTGSTAAGNVVDADYGPTNVGTISGVAPGAYVMSYRVFYYSVTANGSFYTVEGLAALEDIVADGADVLNNSWGGGPGSAGGEFDALDQALINTSQAGVFVAMSNGNAGPGLGTGDHPSPDYINVAASTTGGTFSFGAVRVTAPTPVPPALEAAPFEVADFGGSLAPGNQYDYSIKTAASVDPANAEGCDPWPAGTFDGVMALISRGTCEFTDKVYFAEQAGATAAVIYNNAGDELVLMGCGENYCDEITIPALFIGQSAGEGIVDWYDQHGAATEVQIDYTPAQIGNTPDMIADFSSRGPGVGNVLKPDIAAPGVNIMAQGYDPEATGEARHLGYGQVSGTSMAAPHVAGAAALVREAHPAWTNAEIKSALMTTSKFMDIYNYDGSPAQPLDMGAGRLDLTNVTDPGVILDPPSLSFGQMVTGTVESITVSVRSVAAAQETYDLSTVYTGNGFTQTTTLPGFTISESSITLDPGESEEIVITFDSSQGMGLGDNQGYILLEGDNGHDAHMPAWARVTPPPSGKVLLIDTDYSYLVGFPDYRNYYTEALDELGIPYDVWHADAYYSNPATIPPATILSTYEAIIVFTGDNYYPNGSFTVSTPLTTLDMDRLVEYANGSGALIVMGQDAYWVMEDSFLACCTLGGTPLQDTITDGFLPQLPIVPSTDAPAAFQDIVLDLSGTGTYVGQISLPQHGHDLLPYQVYLPIIAGGDGTDLAPAPTGSASFSYDVASGRLDYAVTLEVTEPVTLTAAHIHEGSATENGPVLYPLFAGPQLITDTFTFDGSVIVEDADEAALLNGNLYVNTHTNVRPASAVRGQILLSPANDGANNQFWIDEFDTEFSAPDPEPGNPAPAYRSLFHYPGPYNLMDGSVAVTHRDQPTLERPGITFFGRTVYTGFGLEGVNNSDTTTSRAELLGYLLDWSMDEPEVTITDLTGDYDPTSPETVLEADVSSNIDGTYGVSYRWDFGDGSDYTPAYDSSVVGHTYETCGDYTVRVEATDSWGNRVIGEQEITVTNCTSPPA